MTKDTAEGLSRQLRSKSIEIGNLIDTCNQLLQDDSKILPNLKSFLLELAVDRLNEQKDTKWKSFKLDPQAWSLFRRICYAFTDSELKIRNSVLRRLKMVDITIEAVQKSGNNYKLVNELLGCLSAVHDFGCVETGVDQANALVVSLLTSVAAIDSRYFDKSKWLRTAIKIFNESTLNSAKISTQKFLNSYTTTTVYATIQTVIGDAVDEETKQILLKSFVSDVILNFKAQQFLISIVKSFAEKIDIDGNALASLFYDTIIKREDLEQSILEEIFIIISNKAPSCKALLLKNLHKRSKALSSPFLSTLLEQEMTKLDSNSVEMINYIVRINFELGFKYGDQIVELLKRASTEIPGRIDLIETIAEAFLRAREFGDFYQKWITLISSEETVFATDALIAVISQKIQYLSSLQIASLIKENILRNVPSKSFSDQNRVFLIASLPITRFAMQSRNIGKIASVKKELKDVLSMALIDHSDEGTVSAFWRLKFMLLGIYSNTDFVADESLQGSLDMTVEQASASGHETCIYKYYVLFSIKEFCDIEISNQVLDSFVKLLVAGDAALLSFNLNRWLIFFDTFMSHTQLKAIFAAFISCADVHFWERLFDNQQLFELNNMMRPMIDLLMAEIATNAQSVSYTVLAKVPLQCFTKQQRIKVIDLLTAKIVESDFAVDIDHEIAILQNLLELPTFKSQLEINVDTLLKVQKGRNTEVITSIIWHHHFNQAHEPFHKEWIDKLRRKITHSKKGSVEKTLEPHHYISFVILASTGGQKFTDVATEFQTAMVKLIVHMSGSPENNIPEIQWILASLFQITPIDAEASKELRRVTRELASVSSAFNDLIFNLLTKLTDFSVEQLYYFMALYVILRTTSAAVDEGMRCYLQSVSSEDFIHGFELLVTAIRSSKNSSLEYVALLSLFVEAGQIKHATKVLDHQLQHLFVQSVCSISDFDGTNYETTQIIIDIASRMLTESGWSLTQHSFEAILDLICNSLATAKKHQSAELYQSAAATFSSILLYHRHRFSDRAHILMKVMSSFLECLFHTSDSNSAISKSIQCGSAFARLMSNLCEPTSIQQSTTNQLNSASTGLKRKLRKCLPALLATYTYLQIRLKIDVTVRAEVSQGIFLIFDILTEAELELVNASLDLVGKNYFKTLLEEYRKFGKWSEDV